MRATFGYISSCVAVRRENLTRRHIAFIESKLEFQIEGLGSIMQAYDEDEEFYYLPRGILLDPELPELPPVVDQRIKRDAPIPDPIIELRSYQKAALKKLKKTEGGVLIAPTGSGKTVLMLYLIGKLKQRTLVIVHTKDLQDQWVERAKMTLGMDEHDIGIIGQGEWQEKDLTIATVQTLARYDFNKVDFPRQFGCVILDEAHRAPAASFSKVLQAMPAHYLYGCTATPTRRDGMHPLMFAIIGPIVARIHQEGMVDKGKLILPRVRFVRTGFKSVHNGHMKRAKNQFARNALYRKMIVQLTESKKRNKLIVKIILKHKMESVLVLSERIEHLQTIYDLLLQTDWQVNAVLVTGKMPMDERREALEDVRQGRCNVLLATQLADEGLDLPVLNVLVLTFPSRAVEKLTQRIGRIMRTADGKESAKVYDLVDSDIDVFTKQAEHRYDHYLKTKMKVKGWKPE